jgi:hypothetical protein
MRTKTHDSFGDDAFMLRGGSSLKIETGGQAMTSVLRLITGALLAVFGHGDKSVITRAAAIGVRRTGLYLDTAPEQTYFCTCYGETELSVNGLSDRLITDEHHNAVMIHTPYRAEILFRIWPVLNIIPMMSYVLPRACKVERYRSTLADQ